MTPRSIRFFPRRQRRAPLALATLALSVLALPGSAVAAPGSGSITLKLKRGGESSLLRQGVKIAYSAKAGKSGGSERVQGAKGATVSLPVVDLDPTGAGVRAGGALVLTAKGGEKASLTDVTIALG